MEIDSEGRLFPGNKRLVVNRLKLVFDRGSDRAQRGCCHFTVCAFTSVALAGKLCYPRVVGVKWVFCRYR